MMAEWLRHKGAQYGNGVRSVWLLVTVGEATSGVYEMWTKIPHSPNPKIKIRRLNGKQTHAVQAEIVPADDGGLCPTAPLCKDIRDGFASSRCRAFT